MGRNDAAPQDDARLAAIVRGLEQLLMAGVFELAADGTTLERGAAVGPREARIYSRFPLGSRLPVADVFQDGRARYLERSEHWSSYPLSLRMQVEARGWPSVAVLPLLRDEAIAGVLYLGFEPRTDLASRAEQLEALAGAVVSAGLVSEVGRRLGSRYSPGTNVAEAPYDGGGALEGLHARAGKILERDERAVVLSVAFPVSLADGLIRQAHREGVSPSVVVCRVLEEHFVPPQE
jgi:hypothetical protein